MDARSSERVIASLGLVLVLAMGGMALVPRAVQAAPTAQLSFSFDDPGPISGQLDAAIPQAVYSFECKATGVGSLVVRTTSGDLAVDATLQDPQGNPFAYGTVVPGTPGVTVSEAFTMPADGVCTATLTRQGNTAGTFEARLLPGFAGLTKWDTFGPSTDSLHMEWEPYASANMTVTIFKEQLRLEVMKDNLVAFTLPTGDDLIWDDSYIQADFTIDGSPSYFEYGFVLRSDEPGDHFYTVTFSSDSDYSVYYFGGEGEWYTVQEWTVSPVVDGSDIQPQVGVLMQGNVFKLYFNGRLVAEVSDPANYASEGLNGLAAATTVDQLDTLTIFADNVVVTRPLTSGTGTAGIVQPTPTKPGLLGSLGAGKTPVPPAPTLPLALPTKTPVPPTPTLPLALPTNTPVAQSTYPAQLESWANASPAAIVNELSMLGIVPVGGGISLTVPSSYGDTSSEGFNWYPLGRGKTFRNFVLGFDARLIYSGEGAGCGMHFRASGTASDSALVFEDGWALLGEFDANGQMLDSSVLLETSAVIPGPGVTNRALVIAMEGFTLMYVNGVLVADTEFVPKAGELALEMYVPADDAGQTAQTYCQLNDIWLWEF
ncbi:MAG: hypothetical protein KJ047_05885 [Anaerolineae bacterium]|nr:hypothetical protein [Anaerolineae bacterium]